ncbi:LOW QUALITY PROTEIN: putative serine-rich repeat protein 2 [Schistosoma mansoni]|uniref:putative serine-rich repeat protein 2 n=1 Tax=Schistosoma mansoni TaxID=6183 RepID=UPI00022DC8C8|nr:LOW QUALITY PROTEIN: putative serine-rich repeat protein 2 [Schistosoma mansoni]|eukprot:XP_018650761.1 LOW QUALITY PROTEIN: putative serine-rich repeat protein 2 [Schistosoma mansoni]
MPNTVNIERHKLNQAMYQKLKKYIMSKRKREQEEKAQDAIVKRLRREREESKRQAEMDTETLENTKKEILVTRKRIEELTSRRNELFQRLKQIASEETSLREKQKSETMAYLAGMPPTQFGLEPNTTSTPNRITAPQTTLPTGQPLQPQAVQHVSVPKHNLSSNGSASIPSINSETLSGSQSPHRPHHPLFGLNGSKPAHTTISTQTGLGMQQSLTSITNNPSATMAAVAAAVAAQQRSMPVSHPQPLQLHISMASLANSSSLAGNSLGIAYPNSSVSLAEVVAALAASGLCSLPTHLSSNPPPISSGNLVPNFTFSSRASPSVPDGHHNRDAMTALSSGNIHPNLSYHQNVIQSANMSKNPAVSIHHNPNLDFSSSTLDTAKVCLAQLAAAAAGNNNNSGNHISQQNVLPSNQQLQKAHQILRSLNASNPLISPLLSGNTSDLDISQTTSTPSSTPISGSPLLPPAPISYRGSITTGQSAQQIQLQQQAHQKQQHNLSKYMTQVDYSSARGPGAQNMESSHLLTPNYTANISSTQGARFTNQQQQLHANNLIMLNLTSTSSHNNAPTLTNTGKCLTGSRHIENNSLRNSVNNNTSTSIQFNSSSSGVTSVTSNSTISPSISNTGSSIALNPGLTPFPADLSSLNYLTSATLAAAFQQQQQQLNKLVMSANNIPSSHGHSNTSGPPSSSSNNSGRRFF